MTTGWGLAQTIWLRSECPANRPPPQPRQEPPDHCLRGASTSHRASTRCQGLRHFAGRAIAHPAQLLHRFHQDQRAHGRSLHALLEQRRIGGAAVGKSRPSVDHPSCARQSNDIGTMGCAVVLTSSTSSPSRRLDVHTRNAPYFAHSLPTLRKSKVNLLNQWPPDRQVLPSTTASIRSWRALARSSARTLSRSTRVAFGLWPRSFLAGRCARSPPFLGAR